MSREWDRRAERQGGAITGVSRRLLLAIFVGSIALGVGIAWLAKAALGL